MLETLIFGCCVVSFHPTTQQRSLCIAFSLLWLKNFIGSMDYCNGLLEWITGMPLNYFNHKNPSLANRGVGFSDYLNPSILAFHYSASSLESKLVLFHELG